MVSEKARLRHESKHLYSMLKRALHNTDRWVQTMNLHGSNNPSFRCLRILDLDPEYMRRIKWFDTYLDHWFDIGESIQCGYADFQLQFSTGEPVVIEPDLNWQKKSDWFELLELGSA
jgi:hypothetical protein